MEPGIVNSCIAASQLVRSIATSQALAVFAFGSILDILKHDLWTNELNSRKSIRYLAQLQAQQPRQVCPER